MTADGSSPDQRVTGLNWSGGAAHLEWLGADPTSPLELGSELAFTFGDDRRCIGIWRSGRRLNCSTNTELAPSIRGAQCPDCHTMERSNSIATDTRLDDPRQFSVYLAHHGSVVKVGITAAERGDARLLEQGALASTIISTGSLVGARRVEGLLKSALQVPDRVSTVRKRAARVWPESPAERSTGLLDLASRVAELDWPEGQQRRDATVVDHLATYGLPTDGLRATAVMLPPSPGTVVGGRLVCTIATDLYFETPAGLTLVDTKLLAGWTLLTADPGSPFTAPLESIKPPSPTVEQDALF
jgi:hypothetical protein